MAWNPCWHSPVNVTQSAPGTLRITAPDGAEVFIDGKRVGETPLDFAVTIEIAQSFRRGNRGSDERASFDRRAQLFDADFVAVFFERAKVGDDFVPVEQFAIDADHVPEMTGRRGDGGLHCTRDRKQNVAQGRRKFYAHARFSSVQSAR